MYILSTKWGAPAATCTELVLDTLADWRCISPAWGYGKCESFPHIDFEKLPTSEESPWIICSAKLIMCWKIKWLCDYTVIDRWKFVMDGPSLTFALIQSQVFLNILLFVHACWICSEADMLLWPPQPALTHSPSCWPQSPVTISFDKSGKQKSVGKNMKLESNIGSNCSLIM